MMREREERRYRQYRGIRRENVGSWESCHSVRLFIGVTWQSGPERAAGESTIEEAFPTTSLARLTQQHVMAILKSNIKVLLATR